MSVTEIKIQERTEPFITNVRRPHGFFYSLKKVFGFTTAEDTEYKLAVVAEALLKLTDVHKQMITYIDDNQTALGNAHERLKSQVTELAQASANHAVQVDLALASILHAGPVDDNK